MACTSPFSLTKVFFSFMVISGFLLDLQLLVIVLAVLSITGFIAARVSANASLPEHCRLIRAP